jgi:hypothetical protein
MTRREQIILGLVGLTFVFVGYVFFLDSPEQISTDPGAAVREAGALKTETETVISKQGLSPSREYTLTLLSKPWPVDPFVPLGPERRERDDTVILKQNVDFIYSAYVAVGDVFVGVINGREYKVGDALKEEGYTLVRIDAQTALIKGPGSGNMIIVPYRTAEVHD